MIRTTALPAIGFVWLLGLWIAPTAAAAQSTGVVVASAKVLPVEPGRTALVLAGAAAGRTPLPPVRSPLPSVRVRVSRAMPPEDRASSRGHTVLIEVHFLGN